MSTSHSLQVLGQQSGQSVVFIVPECQYKCYISNLKDARIERQSKLNPVLSVLKAQIQQYLSSVISIFNNIIILNKYVGFGEQVFLLGMGIYS